MRSGVLLTAMAALLTGLGPATAEQLSCSNSEIVAIISDAAVDQLVSASPGILRRSFTRDAFRVSLRDEYETARSEFTRQCSATLLLTTDVGNVSQEITYTAIQTESGKDLARWDAENGWGAAMLLDLSMQSNLDQIRRRHPGISDAEAKAIFLYGEPGQQQNAMADLMREAAKNDPTMNQGFGASGGNHSQPTTKPQPYAADPNWSQWRR